MDEVARAYLKRLKVGDPPPPSLDALAQLQLAHVLAVPATNWQLAKRERPLDAREAARRIAEPGTGGHPIELNGAFAWLLSRLGFDATLVAAQRPGVPEHAATLARVDGTEYVADVGQPTRARAPVRAEGASAPRTLGSFAAALDAAAAEVSANTLFAERATSDGWVHLLAKRCRWRYGSGAEVDRPLLGWETQEILRDDMGMDVEQAS